MTSHGLLDANAKSESFVSLRPRDNFYQTSAFIPMSFALITTRNEAGDTGIGPHALVYPFEIAEDHSMMLVSRGNSGTAQNIRRTKRCALNYIPYDKDALVTVSRLGYPGQTPEDKKKENKFTLIDSPTPENAADKNFPQIIDQAFQVFECTWDDSFDLRVKRKAGADVSEGFFVLKVNDILLKESAKELLDNGQAMPQMPIFYGFRDGTGFWFAEHKEPYSIPIPKTKETSKQSVFYLANRIDADVRFTEEACAKLTGIPRPFLKTALTQIVDAAKEGGTSLIDPDVLDRINAER